MTDGDVTPEPEPGLDPVSGLPGPALPPFDKEAYEKLLGQTPSTADVTSPPAPVTGAYTVIDHAHDQERGTYRIVVAKPVCIPAYGDNIETMIGYDDERDFVFADDDPRWFNSNGIRLSDDEIAAQQRAIIKQALTPNARAARQVSAPVPRALPGVGDEL